MTTTIPDLADITSVDDLAPLIADADDAYYTAIGDGSAEGTTPATAYFSRLADRARVLVGLYRRLAAIAEDHSATELAADIAVLYWKREAEALDETVTSLLRRVA